LSGSDPGGIGEFSPDNRILGMDNIYQGLVGRVLAMGVRRLVTGRPSGRSQLSRYHSVFGHWVMLIGVPLLAGGLWAWLIPWTWLGVLGLALGTCLSSLALVVAAAVDSTVPPPFRPFCQSNRLGQFFPYYKESGLIEVVSDQLWVAQVPLVFHGVQVGTRMAIVRVGPQDLLVYSPLILGDEDMARVRELGRVRWIVAPNAIHHLFVAPWLAAFPDAQAWAAPGLAERRPDLAWAGSLTNDMDVPWDPLIVRMQVMMGHPWHKEVVLLHEPSESLLVADAIGNLGHAPETGPLSRFLLELFGMGGRPTPPTELKWTLEDKEAWGKSARRVAAWRFERIILAHGRLVDVQAKKVWRDAYAMVLS
jgi:hypothetical protein